MRHLWFSLGFMVMHTVAYLVAGALILKVSRRVYEGRARLMDYLRDMSDAEERGHVERRLLPAQLLRGVLLSVVLYPVHAAIGAMSYGLRAAFLFGLLFVFTHLACAAPCPDNIEGYVYLKPRYFDRGAFVRFQIEMLTYSLLFALPAAAVLF